MKLTAIGKLAMLREKCYYCGAQPGEPCNSSKGSRPDSVEYNWNHGVHWGNPSHDDGQTDYLRSAQFRTADYEDSAELLVAMWEAAHAT